MESNRRIRHLKSRHNNRAGGIPKGGGGLNSTKDRVGHNNGLAQDCSISNALAISSKTFLDCIIRKKSITYILIKSSYMYIPVYIYIHIFNSYKCIYDRIIDDQLVMAQEITMQKEHKIDSLVQDCSNSSALALELLQSCTKLSKYYWVIVHMLRTQLF